MGPVGRAVGRAMLQDGWGGLAFWLTYLLTYSLPPSIYLYTQTHTHIGTGPEPGQNLRHDAAGRGAVPRVHHDGGGVGVLWVLWVR